jgi:uncharacterized damage-inducible protein DinB
MPFLNQTGAPAHAQMRARALDAWRDAELLVEQRWRTFLDANRASRRGAFEAFVTALDAEASAAGELAHTRSNPAEAA